MGKKIAKQCKSHGCKNHAKKGQTYCGTHKPKVAGTTWGGGSSWKQCHTGNILVHETSTGIRIYAGGSSRSGGWWRMMPYPELAIGPSEIVSGKGPKGLDDRWLDAKSAEWLIEPTPVVLALDWPDFGLPKGLDGNNMPKEFWYALVDDIHAKGIKTISTQCMGGHGRTGVQLGILVYLLTPEEERPWTTLAELLAHIHEVYCKEAVEGDKQAQYIAEVLGIEEGDYKLYHARATTTTYAGWGGQNTYFGGKTYCTQCKTYCNSKTVIGGVCDDCYNKQVRDEDAADKQVAHLVGETEETPIPPDEPEKFKCDNCDTEYDFDAGTCDVCAVGMVFPVEDKSAEADEAQSVWKMDDTDDAWRDIGLI